MIRVCTVCSVEERRVAGSGRVGGRWRNVSWRKFREAKLFSDGKMGKKMKRSHSEILNGGKYMAVQPPLENLCRV